MPSTEAAHCYRRSIENTPNPATLKLSPTPPLDWDPWFDTATIIIDGMIAQFPISRDEKYGKRAIVDSIDTLARVCEKKSSIEFAIGV